MTSPTLYHWTCDHAVARIKAEGQLVPNGFTGEAWATTLGQPTAKTRRACGLTQRITACDRMAHRFRVLDPVQMAPWNDVRDPSDPRVQMLEAGPGARPETWWIAHGPVAVTYDPARSTR